MEHHDLDVDTSGDRLVDLTPEVAAFCRPLGDGLLNVFVPHATAGVALFERGAGSEQDVLAVLERLLPRDHEWVHRHGSPGHGADHVLPLLVSPSMTIPVRGGSPELGTWQAVVLVDPNPDNNRRRVLLRFLADSR
jgi:secondary thiamine-phosphate synthase enzyme